MNRNRVVIVGAGQGGLQAAVSLRQEGYEGSITLVNGEPNLPYQRPPLSKAFLKTGDAEKLLLRPEAFYQAKDIDLLNNCWAHSIDRSAHLVHCARGTLRFDHLILATGTRNIRPPIPGIELALDLRSLEDARRLRAKLLASRRIAIIGAGFIGLEVAAVARELGKSVVVAEAANRLMARAVSPETSAWFDTLHNDRGVRFYLSNPAIEVLKDGLILSDGTRLQADLVLLAAGVRPNTELAEEAGLDAENGIRVDSSLLTADPAIYALGDCTCFPDPRTDRHIRLESIQAATDHAKTIAKSIATGEPHQYGAVPWFWSDQFDRRLQIAGLARAEDESKEVGPDTTLRFADGKLSAVETIGNTKLHMIARRLLARDSVPTRDTIIEKDYDLTAVQ